ncbi:hypothetical protein MMS54_28615, partial [Escherichia coli]|nr:hypothetical protein [Escherichia coli]
MRFFNQSMLLMRMFGMLPGVFCGVLGLCSISLAVGGCRGYRDISDSVVKQVSDEVRKGVQKTDIAGLMGERMTQDFQRL